MLRADVLERPFASLRADDAVDVLATDLEEGLDEREAETRHASFGANVIEKADRSSRLMTLLGQFKSPLIVMLLAASAVTVGIGDYQDASFILAAVLVNAGLGYYQEHKAEKALGELKTYLRQRARVIRSGREHEIDATDLVPGDLVRLAQGDRVPADMRLVFANDLEIDEAMLTGEALPAEKGTDPVPEDAAIGDRHGMAYAGTLVTQGIGTGVVTGTGLLTELGRIAVLVGTSENEETPLQALIRVFSMRASIFLGALTAVIFLVGLLAGQPAGEMFVTAVAVAVSAVPEGLPIAMTVILAIGVQRMARRKAVVRKLAAAEALGSTDVILTDKTGTLTTARMEIAELLPAPGISEETLLMQALTNASVLVENPADPPAEWRMSGRVIEMALVRSAALRGVDIASGMPDRAEAETLPFNAVNKFSASLLIEGTHRTLVMVGAPDILLDRSTLSSGARDACLAQIEGKAAAGALMLGVATKQVHGAADAFAFDDDAQLSGLSFQGLIALRDPIRPNVPAALRLVEGYGIRVVLVTGDHRGTAEAVAREAGMRVTEGSVLDAAELRSLSEEDLMLRLPGLSIVARVSPEDKMRIAKAFQKAGLVVAMTGDGVNDAPSIRQADVGIAMGSGTAVARDVADLVLLDDNFETIAAAVEEGRQIMGNLRKVLVYLLSDTADNLFLIGGALLAGLALPLTALQILWVNFFSDSFPAVAFAFERERDQLGPRHRGTLFDPLMNFLILFIGTLTSAFLFALYWGLLKAGYPADIVRTFIFASFASYTIFSAFALRSLTRSIFSYSPFGNPAMLVGVGFGFALILLALYVPFFQSLLDTVPLPASWMAGVACVVLLNIGAIELAKWLFRVGAPARRTLP